MPTLSRSYGRCRLLKILPGGLWVLKIKGGKLYLNAAAIERELRLCKVQN